MEYKKIKKPSKPKFCNNIFFAFANIGLVAPISCLRSVT